MSGHPWRDGFKIVEGTMGTDLEPIEDGETGSYQGGYRYGVGYGDGEYDDEVIFSWQDGEDSDHGPHDGGEELTVSLAIRLIGRLLTRQFADGFLGDK